MQKDPLVSIIIPTYNRERFLHRSIDSVLQQTYTNWELLIIDDRSTDNTKNVVDKYLRRDRRIKYLKNMHKKGPAGARNQGVEQAKGEYIAFLDSDDEWKPWHVKAIIEEFKKNPDVHWIYADYERLKEGKIVVKSVFEESWKGKKKIQVEERGRLTILADKNLLTKALKYSLYACCQCSIVHRNVFDKIKFDELLFAGTDRMPSLEAIARGFKLAYLHSIHLTYYIHPGGVSVSDSSKSIDKKSKVYLDLAKIYKTMPQKLALTKKQTKIVNNKVADIYFWGIGYNCFFRGKKYQEAKQYFLKALKLNPLKLMYWKTFIAKMPYYGKRSAE